MPPELTHLFPDQALRIALVLFLSFLLGIEREEHKASIEHYAFGGVRTYPLIGLVGYALAFLSGDQVLPLAIGLAVVGAFMVVSYRHKLTTSETAGVTSEVSGLLTFLIGAVVAHGDYWIAATLAITALILLELKTALERLTKRIEPGEIIAFSKFLLLSVVILPMLPNEAFTPFDVNPRKTWLVVVAVSGISYGSYVLQRLLGGRGGVLLGALLGGAYSSTATTIALSRRAKDAQAPHLYAGAILSASGMMYVRLVLLVWLLDRALGSALAPAFLALAVLAIGAGTAVTRRHDEKRGRGPEVMTRTNPLEIGPALLFAVVFVAVLVATRIAAEHVGRGAVYGLAAIVGVADVDPFVLGVAQSAHPGAVQTPLHIAAVAIVIAAAANNAAKAGYAFAFSDRRTGRWALALLGALAVAGAVPVLLV